MGEPLICRECKKGKLIWMEDPDLVEFARLKCDNCGKIYPSMGHYISACRTPIPRTVLCDNVECLYCDDCAEPVEDKRVGRFEKRYPCVCRDEMLMTYSHIGGRCYGSVCSNFRRRR